MKQSEQKKFEPSEAREELCCCQSKLAYQDCCKPYHVHQRFPATAEALMRSRYSAYVFNLVDLYCGDDRSGTAVVTQQS